jgi:hypothetical protein
MNFWIDSIDSQSSLASSYFYFTCVQCCAIVANIILRFPLLEIGTCVCIYIWEKKKGPGPVTIQGTEKLFEGWNLFYGLLQSCLLLSYFIATLLPCWTCNRCCFFLSRFHSRLFRNSWEKKMALDGVCKKKIKGGTRNGHKTKAVIYTMECVLYIQHCLVLDNKTKLFFLMGKKNLNGKS